MNMMKTFLLLILVLFLNFSNTAFAQTKAQREVIKKSMRTEESLKAIAINLSITRMTDYIE